MEKFQAILYKYFHKVEKENFLLERLKLSQSTDEKFLPSDFNILLGKTIKTKALNEEIFLSRVSNIDPYGILLENNHIIKFDDIDYICPIDNSLLEKMIMCYNDLSEIHIKSILEFNNTGNIYNDLIQELEEEISGEDFLLYKLKDLYKQILQIDKDGFYLKSLECILHIINMPDHKARLDAIINELQAYRWISYISMFIDSLNGININEENYIGYTVPVYGVSRKSINGQLVIIEDKCFKITDTIVTVNCTDTELLEVAKVLNYAHIDKNNIYFPILTEEDLKLTISINLITREVSINDEPIEMIDTLRVLFMNAQIPFGKKIILQYIMLALDSIDLFIEVDIATKVVNKLNNKQIIVFNYDKVYQYSDDVFYEVQDIDKYIIETCHNMDYDLSNFLKDKISAELLKQKQIRDSKKTIKISIQNTKSEIQKIKQQKANDEIDDMIVNESLQYLLTKQLLLEKKLKNIENEVI